MLGLVLTATMGMNGFYISWAASWALEAVLNAVSNGYGVSVLSGRLVSDYGRRHQVWAAEISDATVNRGFSLVYHKDKLMNREMVAFCDICREFGKGELHI